MLLSAPVPTWRAYCPLGAGACLCDAKTGSVRGRVVCHITNGCWTIECHSSTSDAAPGSLIDRAYEEDGRYCNEDEPHRLSDDGA